MKSYIPDTGDGIAMTDKGYNLSRRGVLKKGAIATGALVLGGAAASGTAAAGVGDGRVLDFHLNNLHVNKDTAEKSKNHVHDASPKKNHGTNNGAELVKDGAVGNAFEFNGQNNYIMVNHDGSLNVTSVTAATWLKFSDSADYHFFLSKRGGDDEYQMYYRGSGRGQSLAYWDGNTVYDEILSLEQNTWHHLAWVVDDTGFRGFLNGEEEVTISDAGVPSGGESPLFIGKDNVGNYAAGTVDEVRLSDRALSGSEIQELVDMKD